MTDKDIIPYILENERKRYEYAKELQKTLRWAILGFLLAVTIIACSYMYFVVPMEEVEVDNGSKAVIHTTVDNGSNVWQ